MSNEAKGQQLFTVVPIYNFYKRTTTVQRRYYVFINNSKDMKGQPIYFGNGHPFKTPGLQAQISLEKPIYYHYYKDF